MSGFNAPRGQASIIASSLATLKAHRLEYLARVNPLLAVIFPVSFLYTQNIGEVPFLTAVATMLAVLATTAIFMAVVWLALRNDTASGFVAASWLLLFFFYGYIFYITAGASIGGFIYGRYRYVLAVEIVIALLVLLAGFRARNFCHGITTTITVVLLIPIVFTWLTVGASYLSGSGSTIVGGGDVESVPLPAPQPDRLPDIYYIILDSYPRQDVLESVYGFDNSQFLDDLERNGFLSRPVARQTT